MNRLNNKKLRFFGIVILIILGGWFFIFRFYFIEEKHNPKVSLYNVRLLAKDYYLKENQLFKKNHYYLTIEPNPSYKDKYNTSIITLELKMDATQDIWNALVVGQTYAAVEITGKPYTGKIKDINTEIVNVDHLNELAITRIHALAVTDQTVYEDIPGIKESFLRQDQPICYQTHERLHCSIGY